MFAYFRAPVPWTELARRTVVDTLADGCAGLAAQLAFYFLLALFPALLFLVALLAYLPLDAALLGALSQMAEVLPSQVLGVVQEQLQRLLAGEHGGLLTFGVAGAVWSSSSAMTAIISALNRAYDVTEWRSWWKRRLIAILLTIALAIFVAIAFVLVVSGRELAGWVAIRIGADQAFATAWAIGVWPLALSLVVIAMDLVYYFAPNAETRWVWVTPGALLATALWLIASFGFRAYVQHFGSYEAVYGAIGGFIVLMLWFYLSAFALLVGAELNAEIDKALPVSPASREREGRKQIGPAAEEADRSRAGQR